MNSAISYLACPYTHPDIAVRTSRFEASARAAAALIHQGLFVYSPITMTHPIDLAMTSDDDTMGSDYWCNFDEAFMRVCDEMIVLTISGWQESTGIAREYGFFSDAGKPIRYLSENGGQYVLSDRPQDHIDS